MSNLADRSISQRLADAALSLKAVRKYQRDRRAHGSNRVELYFEGVDEDWLNAFDDTESNVSETSQLSQALEEKNLLT